MQLFAAMACQHNTDSLNMPTLQGIEGVMHLKTVERGSLSDFKGSDKGAHSWSMCAAAQYTQEPELLCTLPSMWQANIGSVRSGCSIHMCAADISGTIPRQIREGRAAMGCGRKV